MRFREFTTFQRHAVRVTIKGMSQFYKKEAVHVEMSSEQREEWMFPTVKWITIRVQREEVIQRRMFKVYARTDRHQTGCCVVWTRGPALAQGLGGIVMILLIFSYFLLKLK